MGYQTKEIDALRKALVALNEIRPFQIKFEATTAPTTTNTAASLRNRVSRPRSRTTAAGYRVTAGTEYWTK